MSFDTYFKIYGQEEPPQENDAASFDSQIKNISLAIAEFINSNQQGTVVDIGCGKGTILRRLAETKLINENNGWYYQGTDFSQYETDIVALKNELDLSDKVHFLQLEKFYKSWVMSLLPSPRLLIIRNVLHELSILQTSELIELLVRNMTLNDKLIIQDLMIFPSAERGNASWESEFLKELINQCGFEITLIEEPSKSGNKWFSAICKLKVPYTSNLDFIRLVKTARVNQYNYWMNISDQINKEGKQLVDFDLQRLALHTQLYKLGEIESLSEDNEKKEIALIFTKLFNQYEHINFSSNSYMLPEIDNFRDRAHNQDQLEFFLREDKRISIITGGKYMGKTALVNHVLAKRAYEKRVISIDCHKSSNIWNILEQYLEGLGIKTSYVILETSKTIKFDDIFEKLKNLVLKACSNSIVVFDHFENLLNFNLDIDDFEISKFFALLCQFESSKIIVTSNKNPKLNIESSLVDNSNIPVARFPEGKFVENILDDVLNRKDIGIEGYPEALIKAIDRVPYLAVIASKMIKQTPKLIEDDVFLEKVSQKLIREVIENAVNDDTKHIIEIFSFCRVPLPKEIFVNICGMEAVEALVNMGLVYKLPNYANSEKPLLQVLGVFREKNIIFDSLDSKESKDLEQQNLIHKKIQHELERLYCEDEDARWIREIYYHKIASGDLSDLNRFGRIYSGELFNAGEYWFHTTKNYQLALEAFTAAKRLGFHSYELDLRLASCTLRLGQIDDGIKMYDALITQYPNAFGVKLSYIDSWLYIKKYYVAIEKLKEFDLSLVKLKSDQDSWPANQWGRAYFAMGKYKDAIRAYELALKLKKDEIAYSRLASSYHKIGSQNDVQRTLEAGFRAFRSSRLLKLAYATYLIQNHTDAVALSNAETILIELHEKFPNRGNILHQLCKLYAIQGHVPLAYKLLKNIKYEVHPREYLVPIKVELYLAERQWEKAFEELGNVDKENIHLVGLKLKTYLRNANDVINPHEQIRLATNALEWIGEDMIKTSENIPFLVLCLKLARLAGLKLYNVIETRIKYINADVFENINFEEHDSYLDNLYLID